MNIKDFSEDVFCELFKIRSEKFENNFAEEHKKQLQESGVGGKKESILKKLEDYVSDTPEKLSEIRNLFEKYEGAYLKELDFWVEKYYKLGVSDAFTLKENIIELQNAKSEN